jgi:hypothetical protein
MSWIDRQSLQAEWDMIALPLESIADPCASRSGTAYLRVYF